MTPRAGAQGREHPHGSTAARDRPKAARCCCRNLTARARDRPARQICLSSEGDVQVDYAFKRELIEQRSLFDLPTFHHELQFCASKGLNHASSCVATVAFFNTIDPKRTSDLRIANFRKSLSMPL